MVTNKANTTFEMFKTVQELRIFASMALKGLFGEETKDFVQSELCINEKMLDELKDFYNSSDWEVIL